MTIKTIFILLGSILFTTLSFSQTDAHGHSHVAPENPDFCGNNHQMEKLYEENPVIRGTNERRTGSISD